MPLMLTYHQKRQTCHWCMQASRYWKGISKSTSWIMCWCQQEATHCRRALMYPTSTTRNECSDFGDGIWLTTQGSGMAIMKMKVYGIAKDEFWLNDFSWTCRWHWNELVALTRNKVMDGMIDQWYDNHQANNPTQIVTMMEWKCHVQERPTTIKWFSPFSHFPQSLLTSTSLFLLGLRRITYFCCIIPPFGWIHHYLMF